MVDVRKCLLLVAGLVIVTSAWNAFWEYLIQKMESAESIEGVVNGFTYGLGVLAVGAVIAVIVHQRGTNLPPSSPKELLAFITINLVAAIVCFLLWIWIKVPEEAGSPALSAMSEWGWGVVAMPAYFGICFIGIHLLSRKTNA